MSLHEFPAEKETKVISDNNYFFIFQHHISYSPVTGRPPLQDEDVVR